VRDVVNNISLKPRDEYPTPTGRSSGERNTSTSIRTSSDRGASIDATTASPSSSSSYSTTNSTNRTTNP